MSLIVLGIAIIIGVYLFTSFRKKRENRRHFERDFSRIDLSDVILKDDMKDEPTDIEDLPPQNKHSNIPM